MKKRTKKFTIVNGKWRKMKNRKLDVMLIITLCVLCYCVTGLINVLTYDYETNNCTHQSSRLEGFFESFGIPVTLKIGHHNKTDGHMWIRLFDFIDIDSGTLLPYYFHSNTLTQQSFDNYGEYERYKNGTKSK